MWHFVVSEIPGEAFDQSTGVLGYVRSALPLLDCLQAQPDENALAK